MHRLRILLWLLHSVCFVLPIVLSFPQDVENELHNLLTNRERESLFGSRTGFHYETAQVSWQRIRRRRYADFVNETFHLVAVVSTKKNTIHLHLHEHTDIIGPNFKMVIRHHNFTEEILPSSLPLPECLYQGRVVAGGDGVAALSLCGTRGMTGLIIISGTHYILQPLPPRLRNAYGNRTHVIYEKDNEQTCAGQGKNNLVVPPEEGDDEDNEIDDSPYPKKSKRASKETKIVETAVFVDDEMYKKVKEDFTSGAEDTIREIVFTMINAVQLLYNQPSLAVPFKILLVRLEIIKDGAKGPNKNRGDIKNYLTSFCRWETNNNPKSDKNVDHWDHAIMLSGLNLYQDDPKNHKVIGLAWVAGMCRRNYSCSINEGNTFESVFVITHEMGHNLGMHHDGSENECSVDGHIMSPSLGPGKITWSSCSRKYLDDFLKGRRIICLDDSGTLKSNLDHEAVGELPGKRFTSDEQCWMAFGGEYKPYKSSRKPFDNFCRELWCAYGNHAKRAHPALDGTICDTGKICMYGDCVYDDSGSTSGSQRNRDWREPTTQPSVFNKAKKAVEKVVDKMVDKMKKFFG